jgi:hypothetical protein
MSVSNQILVSAIATSGVQVSHSPCPWLGSRHRAAQPPFPLRIERPTLVRIRWFPNAQANAVPVPADLCSCPTGNRGPRRYGGSGSSHTSARTRSGSDAARRIAGDSPLCQPAITGHSDPAASRTTRRSAERVSRFGAGTLRVESPVARRSCRITRANAARPSTKS